ncbi:MAG TPA: LamG-like jellyroll fold domain-containing protein, partial [Candidatus Polarisedimenticolia bacterium]|nr:LamG-like jellyroll fold domain-containing protein [Candidatus Polarisedimenticolia bacterium]
MPTPRVIKEALSFKDVTRGIGKLAASLILSVALLPQLARSAPSYAAAALSDNPIAFWQLTETNDPSGGAAQAHDSSGNGHNGLYGTTSQNAFNNVLSPQPPTFLGFTNGQGALACSAGDANSPVAIPFLNLNTNAVTITMWINPSGGEAASTGLLMNRNGGDAAGLCFGTTLNSGGMPALGYTWNTNAQATWSYNSGLYPAAGNWNFVALVVQSNSATLYLCLIDPNTGQTNVLSAVNAIAHTPESFGGGNIWLGSDVTGGGGGPDATRIFSGQISDVAVYNSSLTSDQILALFAAGLGVQGFPPSITQQPQSQYILAGSRAQVKATGINGTSPISYQWQLNGTNINLLSDSANFSGANSNVLTILSASASDAGSYQLILNNSIATTLSSNATVTIQTTNLVGEWLDGSTAGTNFLDVSGYSLSTNHGAYFVGGGTYVFTNDVPPGKSGQSLFLYNGDTGLAISNSSTLDASYDDTYDNRIDNTITVACWAKGWPGNWNPFVSKYGETTPSPSGGWQLRA